MKSILHEKDGTCYLCRKLHHYSGRYSYTEEHHVFEGTANRRLSEKYGLKVDLCIFHHREGPEAVHLNSVNDLILKMDAQKVFEQTHSREEFMDIFGKNWLEEDPWESPWIDRAEADGAAGADQEGEDAAGFRFLQDEEIKWLSWANGEEWGKIQCPMMGNEWVMTYYPPGAPCYYTYTAPFVEDGEICYYRFDHDEGCWDENIMFCLGEYEEGIVCKFR